MSVDFFDTDEYYAQIRAQQEPPRRCVLPHPECRTCDGCAHQNTDENEEEED